MVWKIGKLAIARDAINIMLGECPDDKPPSEINCHSYFAYLEVENIEEYQSREVEILSSIENKPLGAKRIFNSTIDGHRITFVEGVLSQVFEKFMKELNTN